MSTGASSSRDLPIKAKSTKSARDRRGPKRKTLGRNGRRRRKDASIPTGRPGYSIGATASRETPSRRSSRIGTAESGSVPTRGSMSSRMIAWCRCNRSSTPRHHRPSISCTRTARGIFGSPPSRTGFSSSARATRGTWEWPTVCPATGCFRSTKTTGAISGWVRRTAWPGGTTGSCSAGALRRTAARDDSADSRG